MTLRVVLEYDEVIDSWAAYCPEMPGINSCGATQEEAAANFKEAACCDGCGVGDFFIV